MITEPQAVALRAGEIATLQETNVEWDKLRHTYLITHTTYVSLKLNKSYFIKEHSKDININKNKFVSVIRLIKILQLITVWGRDCF